VNANLVVGGGCCARHATRRCEVVPNSQPPSALRVVDRVHVLIVATSGDFPSSAAYELDLVFYQSGIRRESFD